MKTKSQLQNELRHAYYQVSGGYGLLAGVNTLYGIESFMDGHYLFGTMAAVGGLFCAGVSIVNYALGREVARSEGDLEKKLKEDLTV